MKVLALETATDFSGVGVFAEDIFSEFILHNLKGRQLMPFIDRVLKENALKLAEIDLLAVGIGPGFYTGLRCGLAIMKGLAFSLNKPLIGISTLDTIACNFLGCRGKVIVILNAYGGEVYAGVYSTEIDVKRHGDYFTGPIEDMMDTIKGILSKEISERIVLAGTGVKIFEGQIKKGIGKDIIFSRRENWVPRPSFLARLSISRFRRGRLPHPDRILPLYLKKSEAERKWERYHSHP